MLKAPVIVSQINKLTSELISIGLSESQNFPSVQQSGNTIEIGICNSDKLSIVLKNLPYKEIYNELKSNKIYNILMLDGALIQMFYTFNNGKISAHRLAFFSSPTLELFQNEPELYEMDEIYADVIMKNIIPFPIRFDFDAETYKDIIHPMSHLTLGQYKNCRIPVSSALTPFQFIEFILRNFYNTAFIKFNTQITKQNEEFALSISNNEKLETHLRLTSSTL